VHIVIGTAGAGLETGGFSDQFGNYSLVHLEEWGYLRVQATEATLSMQVSTLCWAAAVSRHSVCAQRV
jgi:hypothetical protein